MLAGPDGFFRPCSHHRVRPSYGDFLNSFPMKAHAGPYGSCDKYLLLTEFEVRTVSYGPSFFPLIYGPSAKRAGHKSTETTIRNLQYGPRKRG